MHDEYEEVVVVDDENIGMKKMDDVDDMHNVVVADHKMVEVDDDCNDEDILLLVLSFGFLCVF